ncbi:MAG: Gfo/Idh/MocA family oxidoreductase [Pirellulaceae bacterium]
MPQRPSRDLPNRRAFLSASAVTTTAVATSGFWSFPALAQDKPRNKVERLGVGSIGLRYQGTVIAEKAQQYGDIVAVADVDFHVRKQAKASFGSSPGDYENYQELLARKDVDVVTIGAPDHWHAKMLIDACRAGKDVYCEKPLTLTIDEGKVIRDVVAETGKVVQVGSWQRSDSRFRLAVEMVRQGRIGKLESVEVILGPNEQGGPFETRKIPGHFNWELWQGQTPDMPYIPERSHYTFRWWYAYSGGQMTDWGAHHLDIANWAIGEDPVLIEGTADYPNAGDNHFDVAKSFNAKYTYPSGVVMTVSDTGRNGILFTGSEGRLFVNRGTISGKPVEDLATNPLPRDQFKHYDFDNQERPERAGKLDAIVNHMGNFFDCVQARKTPVSDIESQHRSATVCHLGNIAMRVGRPLTWDPKSETFPGDDQANTHLSRAQRAGYEVA